MFYDPCARRLLLAVLFFGLFVPRTFAAFAVCNSGWDWVSHALRFFGEALPRAGRWIDVCILSRLPIQGWKTLVKSPAPSRQIVWDLVCLNCCSTPTSVVRLLSTAVYYLGPIPQGVSYLAPQRSSSSLKCECNTVMYMYLITCVHNFQPLITELRSLIVACTACQNTTT